MKEFKDGESVLLFRTYSNKGDSQSMCFLNICKIIGKENQYSQGEYALGQLERIKFLWTGDKYLKDSQGFKLWDKKTTPYGYVPGITFSTKKFIYKYSNLELLKKKFAGKQKKFLKRIFETRPEAFIIEL